MRLAFQAIALLLSSLVGQGFLVTVTPDPPYRPGSTAFNASKVNVGFSVGAGIEVKRSLWLPAG